MRARAHRALLLVFGKLPRPVRLLAVRLLTPRFTVGAVCFVERADGQVLLIQHSYRRRWGLPGGLLQRNEEAETGASREVLEEVGVAVELIGEPTVVVSPRSRRVDIVYRAHLAGGTRSEDARPTSPEIVEARWFPPTELPELQEETAAALRAIARASLRPAARTLAR